nr:MAG TPA_asm: DNA polymerase [Caudoviricetes sp.]
MNYTEERPTAVWDTECFPNFWSIGFKAIGDGRRRRFFLYENHPLDRRGIANVLRKWRIVGFNSNKYDLPMLALAMRDGTTCADLKQFSDELIQSGTPHWKLMERLGLTLPDFIDSIDLMEVSPAAAQKVSLKISGGRLHSHRMQDLPFEIDRRLTWEDVEVVNTYHDNDLDLTEDLAVELQPQLDLRAEMSVKYRVDLRSKSDAQIAEAVIKAEVERITNKRLWRPDIVPGNFYYKPPGYLRFESQAMRQVLHDCRTLPFTVNRKGVVEMPKFLSDRKIVIGQSVYRMGIGGLHSSEESICHIPDGTFKLKDRDVTSYYPRTILEQGLSPAHIGPVFLKVYKTIYDTRIDAKAKSKNKADPKRRHWENTAESLKIVLNGSFGKLGSSYSSFYSPNLMIQVTLTGQLAILMLIERLELAGISVVSANTDGIVSKVPIELEGVFKAVVTEWEWDTNYETEETEYKALYSRDVNNYMAVNMDGSVKLKGAFAPCGPGLKGAMGLKKNPAAEIATEAAREFLANGVPIEDTVNRCQDVRKFVVVRRVTGGCCDQDGVLVGKAVRWIYSTEVKGPLLYVKDGKNVPRSNGARPLMELPDGDECPDDLDRAWYIREAYAILQDVGYGIIDPDLKDRAGYFFGRREKAVLIHTVDATTGIALCGNERTSIREQWTEYAVIPSNMKHCPKCRKAWEL